MKRFRVFFNEGIVSTVEAETKEEARELFLEEKMEELDMWYDFEEVPAGPWSEALEKCITLREPKRKGSGTSAKTG